jgi:hypothetical protein
MRHDTIDLPDSSQSRLDLALNRELRAGERIRWQGKQLARISVRGFGIYLFAIPWTAFALFWMVMAAGGVSAFENEGAGVMAWAFPLFGLPFVVIGLAMLAAPFWPIFQSGKIIYAVTNERVIKIALGRGLDVKSLPAHRIGLVDRHERRDGSGSLKIAVGIGTDSDGDKTTEYFELGEAEDILGAHDEIAKLGQSALAQTAG